MQIISIIIIVYKDKSASSSKIYANNINNNNSITKGNGTFLHGHALLSCVCIIYDTTDITIGYVSFLKLFGIYCIVLSC